MHSFGAFIVLEALGPCNITTEIEKDVLIAQVELMVRIISLLRKWL